jgi:hypothetical protein
VQLALLACHAPDRDGNDVLDVASLRALLCRPLYVAADSLLDMLMQTEGQLNRIFEVRFTEFLPDHLQTVGLLATSLTGLSSIVLTSALAWR